MKTLDKTATRIFHLLTDGLEPGGARYIDNAHGTFMRVAVDCLAPNLFALAHRFEQNGDLCPDPDVEFLVDAAGGVCPTAIDQMLGYHRYVSVVPQVGQSICVDRAGQADLTSFCNGWMRTIADQQNLGAELARTAADGKVTT